MFKKAVSLILVLVIFSAFSISVFASSGIAPRYDDSDTTNSTFSISSSGLATTRIEYARYEQNFSSARITIELQKRNLLVFWKDITSWEITSTQDYYITERTYQVDNGTYRVNITYEFFNTDGTSEVIERTIKCTY